MLLLCQISYSHIKLCLTMLNSGMASEAILSCCQKTQNADELVNKASETPQDSICSRCIKTPLECKSSTQPLVAFQYQKTEQTASVPINHGEDLVSNKRQRVIEPVEGISNQLEATESSVLDWLKNFNEGVSSMPNMSLIESPIC